MGLGVPDVPEVWKMWDVQSGWGGSGGQVGSKGVVGRDETEGTERRGIEGDFWWADSARSWYRG